MSDHDYLFEVIEDWDLLKVEHYLIQLEARREELDEVIRRVKKLRKKKSRKKKIVDTGARDGR